MGVTVPASPSLVSASDVDAAIWRAIAGSSVEIPPVNSSVYYFPQGHLEHWSVDGSACGRLERSCFQCQVLSVNLMWHPTSDEAFVKFLLQPQEKSKRAPVRYGGEGLGDGGLVALGKVLTLSDANNGGGFSVPRSCADSIFPQLDFGVDPPVQTLRIRDTHNTEYEFRHIYRGTPRRHLLTTGWSRFVNKKRLIAGDAVIFMRRKSTNELFVGIRRSRRIGGNSDWEYGEHSENRYPREPLDAIRNAARGMAFEVVYYPRIGSPDFVVRAEKVAAAFKTTWSRGMRIEIVVEAEDSTQVTFFEGTVTSATGPWGGYPWPWRMLEVTWNEPEPPFRNMNRLNPWEVEYDPLSQPDHPTSPPSKRNRNLQNTEILIDGARVEEFGFAPMAGPMNFPVVISPSFSSDMQGARQDEVRMPSLLGDQSEQSPVSGNSSCGQQTGEHFSSEDLSRQKEDTSPATQSTTAYIQLFGKIIHQAHNPDSTNNVSKIDDESKEVHGKRNDTDICSP